MFERIKAGIASAKEKVANWNWEKSIKGFFEKCRWFNIQLTTAFGITTIVHWSVPAFVLFLALVDPFQAGIAILAFLSVVPHEYGHALAARWYGIKTRGIVLYPLGGVAMLEPNKDVRLERWRELVVAAAGPLVSLGLALFGFWMALHQPLPPVEQVGVHDLSVWFWFGAINTVMFVFNMIPAFPMDGGRMLRAVINLFTNHVRSTEYAYYCSLAFCIVIGLYGFLLGSLMLPISMMLVHLLARLELVNVRMQAAKEAAKLANKTPLELVIEPEKNLSEK